MAAAGGWQLCVAARRGPGVRCAFLLRRPGLLVGAALFLCLVRWLPGFVWQIDFGGLDAAAQQQFRAVLAQHGVWEGAWLAQQKLQAAQDALDSAMQGLGWVSLNFAGGCLFVEQTVRDIQPVQQDPSAGALYAKAGGQVVSVLLQSGFASRRTGGSMWRRGSCWPTARKQTARATRSNRRQPGRSSRAWKKVIPPCSRLRSRRAC